MNIKRSLGLAASLVTLSLATVIEPSHAAYIASIEQVGTNVVTTGSGSIDTNALDLDGFGFAPSGFIVADAAAPGLGTLSQVVLNSWSGIVGPTSFGTGKEFYADSGAGSFVFLDGSVHRIALPEDYVSGTSLGTSTDTYHDTTLAALGLEVGLYEWTWGSGADADSFSLQIGPASARGAVPEPASLALLGLGLAAMGVARRKRAH